MLTRHVLWLPALAVALLGWLGPVSADDAVDARRLLVEAVVLSNRAGAEADLTRKVSLLTEAVGKLDEIVDTLPGTALAVKIVTGQRIGDFDPDWLRMRLDSAFAAYVEGDGTASPPAEPYRGSIPVAPVAPGSRAERVLFGVAGWLDRLVGENSTLVRLALAAPMSAIEHDGTVTLRAPGARLYPVEAAEYFDLGDLLVTVQPLSDIAYGFDLSLPEAIPVRDRSDAEEARITIGTSDVHAVWRADLGTTTAYDVEIGDVSVVVQDLPYHDGPQTLGVIGRVRANQNIVQRRDGLWDGYFSFDLSGLSFDVEPGDGISVGGFSFASRALGFDLGASASLSNMLALGGLEPPEAGQVQRLLEALQTVDWGLSDGGMRLSNLNVREGGRTVFTLRDVTLDMRFAGSEAPVDIEIVLGVHGLAVPEDVDLEFPPGFIPRSVEIGLTLHDFPLRAILAMTQELALRNAAGAPPVDEETMVNMLLGRLVAARSGVHIRRIHISAPLYTIEATGALSMDGESAFGVVGDARLALRGIGGTIAALAEEASVNREAQEAMAFFILLQGVGRAMAGGGAAGDAIFFDLAVHGDGAISINDRPADALFGF